MGTWPKTKQDFLASLNIPGNLGNPPQFSCRELKADWESQGQTSGKVLESGVRVPVEFAGAQVSLTVR